ncbi:MAG: glutathione S-transferase [Gemmobacter sp.]
MRLYFAPTSPFVRKVMILLHENGQTGAVSSIPASGTPIDPGTMPVAQNPLGKIPCLERDGLPSLYDSRVICRYLDSLAGSRHYPAGERLWEALTLEATADGICDAAILMRYEDVVRPEEHRHAPWREAQWAKVVRALDTLEARWMAHLAGPFDIGQIALVAALGYLDLRFANRDWRGGRPGLAAWYDRMQDRPAVAATRSAA